MEITNENKENNNPSICTITECVCTGKSGLAYNIKCSIKGRSTNEYLFIADTEYISKPFDKKRLWMSEDALNTVSNTVKMFESHLEDARKGTYRELTAKEGHSLLYKHINSGYFDFILQYDNPLGEREVREYRSLYYTDMFRELNFLLEMAGFIKAGENATPKVSYQLNDNPLYKAAMESGDKTILNLMTLCEGIANDQIVKWIEENITGKSILPAVSSELDRDYYVRSDTIDQNLLKISGYTISHKPHFAMSDCTHLIWTLNPYRRSGIDAAPASVEGESTAFEDFLKIVCDHKE